MEYLFYGGIVLLILFGPWIFTAIVGSRQRADATEIQTILNRLAGVERALQRAFAEIATLKGEGSQAAAPPSRTAPPEREVVSTPGMAEPAIFRTPTAPPAYEPPEAPPAAQVPPPRPVAPKVIEKPVLVEPRRTVEPPTPPIPYVPSTSPTPPPAPTFASVGEESRGEKWFDIEETLGANWLNKLGVIILVLGVGFFLAYQLTNLGPAGKVSVGVLVGVAMLGAGIRFERNERYRVPARGLIGGGWALLYFVAFAMFYIPAAKVIDSQPVDLVLMLLVAAAMVAHTLRYDSQTVTSLAFLLAFAVVTIHHAAVLSLAAGVILTVGLVVIVLWRKWYALEVLGILAAYLNHFYWLMPVVSQLPPVHREFPGFRMSTALLTLYWVAFRTSYLIRSGLDDEQENISTIAALLNGGLFLGILKYQAAHPEWAFWALLVLGAVELALAQIPNAKLRRMPFIILTIIGASLMIAAIPFRYSGNSVAILWLVEGEALFLAGIWAKEVVFRRLGMLTTFLVTLQLLMQIPEAYETFNWHIGVALLVSAATFYLDHLWFGRRNSELFEHSFDSSSLRVISFFGGLALLEAVAVMMSDTWMAAGWVGVALLLSVAARVLDSDDMSLQAIGIAAIGVVRLLVVNVESDATWHSVSLRLLTVGSVAAMTYAMGLILRPRKLQGQISIAPAFSWVGSTLVAVLCWYELRPVAVAVAWAILGIILLEVGLSLKSWNLRLQAYLALIAAFGRIYFVNINASGPPGEISPRMYTIVPLALIFFYVYARAVDNEILTTHGEDTAGIVAAYFGTATVASLVFFELPRIWVAAGWSGLCILLMAIGWQTGRRVFVHHGVALGIPVVWRGITYNLLQTPSLAADIDQRWLTVGSAVIGLLIAVGLGFAARRRDEEPENGLRLVFDHRPEQLLFFAMATLLTVMLAFIMRSGMITISWGLEGVAVFLFALMVGERSFRLCGLGLLMLCVGKIFVVDFWSLALRDKWITLIILGAAMMLVSFLYTRYRETIRQYL